jgi:chorismate mutase/prephenate dehydratase
MAKTLAELRVQIDAVDQELLSLLNRRAGLAHEVGEIKRVEAVSYTHLRAHETG